ncbi:MAG: MmgE/PrpD family protein [Pseudomonadota bacterium]
MRDLSETVPHPAIRFALDRSVGDIPEAALEAAATLLLDTLGVCIAAAPMEAGRIARDTAVALYGAGTPDLQRTLLFDGRQASDAGAAFAAATQIDNLDAHDGYNPTKGHIGCTAVPALVVSAEPMPDLSGRDALAALVVAYEVAGRAGIALHASVSDYHTSGAWNALGVAALAARLRGTTPEVLRHALGIAEYHGPRSQMMREIANPTMLHDGSGMGALVGLSALTMAELGFTGAPAITVEAEDAAPHWADLGALWQVGLQYIKPYPICRWAHAAIDAARALRDAQGIAPENISKVTIRSFQNAVQLFPGMPETTSQAQYSLSFAVAAMLVHGRIGLPEISGRGLTDPAVVAMHARIDVAEAPEHEARYPEGRWADVTLRLTDGTILVSGDVHAHGGPECPMPRAEVIAKFEAFAGPVLGDARMAAIRDSALALPGDGMRFEDLARHLRAAP